MSSDMYVSLVSRVARGSASLRYLRLSHLLHSQLLSVGPIGEPRAACSLAHTSSLVLGTIVISPLAASFVDRFVAGAPPLYT